MVAREDGIHFPCIRIYKCPTMNQAEVVYAGWANRDRPNMSLLDAYHADVRDSLLLEMELQGLQSGSTTKGRGPTFADHTGERHGREVGKEMFAADQADSSDGLCIDPKSSHRPKTQRKNSKKDKTSYGKQCCWTFKCDASTDITNTMPSSTHSSIAAGPSAPARYQQHLFQQLPCPQQSVAYNPTGPVSQPTPKCSNDQPRTGSSGQMHMPGTQMRPLAPPPASPQVMWYSGMSTNKYEFLSYKSHVLKSALVVASFSQRNIDDRHVTWLWST